MLGKSTKLIVAKIISVGKKAVSKADKIAAFSFSVIILAIIYVRMMLAIDNKNGNIIVANSFTPKILKARAVINK